MELYIYKEIFLIGSRAFNMHASCTLHNNFQTTKLYTPYITPNVGELTKRKEESNPAYGGVTPFKGIYNK